MLRTLALLALVCLCAGAKTYRRTMPMPDNADLEPMNSEPMPFRAHTEHRFLYNMQIASGLIAPFDEDATSAPQQKAVMRGQCLVLLQFASERHAQLRLEQCRIGEQNEPMSEPQMVQPMDAFEPKLIPEDKQMKLELPCQFSYEDGLIERVQFHEEDDVWSRNLKRAVLNMVQMNLKANSQQQEEQSIEKANQGKTYTIPETTLEGACQTSYTIYKLRGEQQQQFNVTKSIDFKQCQQVADVAYGYQTQQPQAKCAQCQQFWAQKQGQQQQLNGEQHPCAKCDPKEVKEQELDRSTVIRCQIQKDDQEAQQMALKRCELVSQYVYSPGCAAGWSEFGNHCYKVIIKENVGYTWDEAKEACETLEDGCKLASVHGEAENIYIAGLLKKLSDKKRGCWIGMRLERDESKEVKGCSWSDGTAVDWANPTKMADKCRGYMATGGDCKLPWLYGEPHKRGSGKCVHFTGLDYTYTPGTWSTLDCNRRDTEKGDKMGAICKSPKHALA